MSDYHEKAREALEPMRVKPRLPKKITLRERSGMVNRRWHYEVVVEGEDPFDVEHHHFITRGEAERFMEKKRKEDEC